MPHIRRVTRTQYGAQESKYAPRNGEDLQPSSVSTDGIGRKNRVVAGEYKIPIERELIQAIKGVVEPYEFRSRRAGLERGRYVLENKLKNYTTCARNIGLKLLTFFAHAEGQQILV